MSIIRYVGMDVDKEGIDLAVYGEEGNEAILSKRIANQAPKIREQMRRLTEGGNELKVCYEAGPCGYEIKRLMDEIGIECRVVAPGLVPQRPSDRVKTNRRDAEKLGRMLRAGELEGIHVPTPETEGVRDLLRCREAIKDDLMRVRHRLSKFLLRHGKVWWRKPWTRGHEGWLNDLEWELETLKQTFEQYRFGMEEAKHRLKVCDEMIQQYAQQEPYRSRVESLRCFRGIDTLTAMAFMTEIEDFRRFPHARMFMSYLGLGVSEYSTGTTQRRGGITKAGNGHLRRLLVESAWHYRHKPYVNRRIMQVWQGKPSGLTNLALKAMTRLYRRYHRLVSRGKCSKVAVVAVARELAGFIWASQVDSRTQEAVV